MVALFGFDYPCFLQIFNSPSDCSRRQLYVACYCFYYDFSGNLTGEYRQTDGGNLSYFLSYDSDGNQVEKTSINGQTKTITTGTDEDGKSYVSNDGVTAKTTTDDFGKTTQVKTIRCESVNI